MRAKPRQFKQRRESVQTHGGEAEASRRAYVALGVEEQRDLVIFLLSLTRQGMAIAR